MPPKNGNGNGDNGKGDKGKKNNGDQSNNQNGEGANGDQGNNGKGKKKEVSELSPEQIKTITESVSSTIIKELDGKFDSKLDSRIGKLTTTLYKKLGVKDEGDGGSSGDDGEKTGTRDVELLKSTVKANVKTLVAEELTVDDKEKGIIESLIDFELRGVDFNSEEFILDDTNMAVKENVVKTFNNAKKVFQDQKVDALKKAGQLKDPSKPGAQSGQTKASEEYGKEIATKRHKLKKEE